VTIYRRRNGRWAVQIYDPGLGRSRQVGTYDTKRDAKIAEVDAIGKTTAGGSETVGSFAGRWTTDYSRPKASTNAHNRERVHRFAEQHARRRLDSITVEDARRWVLRRPGDLGSLRAMFTDARRDGKIAQNPFSGLGVAKKAKRLTVKPDWLSAQDVDRLASVALKTHGDYGPTMAAMVTFAAYTGVRPGELFALRFDDLDGTVLHVRRAADSKTRAITAPKNGQSRTIVYPVQARQAVEAAPRFHGQELVFVAPRGGQLWAPHFSWLWSPVRAAFGRPKMAWYELRHFCATHLLDLGLSPSDVAYQLGHTDNGKLVMETYGHPSEMAARGRILAALDGYAAGDVADLRERKAGGA
jgi:integrase